MEDLKFPSMPESEPSSPQPSDKPDLECDKPDLECDKPDLEWCLRREHDVALIYADEDDDVALNIMYEITEVTGLDVRLQTDECFGANVVERPKNIASQCWLVLVIHTSHTAKNTTTSFTNDELIARIRIEKCQDYIRPLTTEPGLPPLPGLAAIDPLPWDSQSKRTRTKKKIKEIIAYQKQEDGEHKVETLKLEALVKLCNRHDVKIKQLCSDDDVYKMDGSRKGLMMIINNCAFKDLNKYPSRESSCKDADALQKLFRGLGFDVTETKTNLTADGIKEAFKQHVKTFDQSEYCCFAAAILSHGRNGGVLGTDGNFVSFKEIKDIFIDDHWILHTDKPKLFFIQSCQTGSSLAEEPICQTDKLPREAHFYWSFATVPGKGAMREEDDGSYFIKSIEKVFATYARKKHLDELMTKVAYDVGRISAIEKIKSDKTDKTIETGKTDNSPQVVRRDTTLQKLLYFFPGI